MSNAAIGPNRRGIRGAGIGLRTPHFRQLLEQEPKVPWLEILSDNFISEGGLDLVLLDAICEKYPTTLHGVGMSLGGTAPLDWEYLKKLKVLFRRTGACWISEHACFTHNGRHFSHDLLPVPYTDEAISNMAERITQVQDFLGEQLLLENVSAYLGYQSSTFSESQFLAEVAERSDCLLLLDINNAYVTSKNLGGDPLAFVQGLPLPRVAEIHLAGFADKGSYLLDAHNNPVSEEVWLLYQSVLKLLPDTPTLIEWDNDIPELEVLLGEAEKAATLMKAVELIAPAEV